MCGNFSRMKRMKRYANQLYSGRDFAQVLLPTSSCRKENSSRQLTNIYFFHKKKISKIVHLFQNHNYDEAGKYYGLILTGINKKSWPIGSYQKFFAKKCPKCIKIIQIIIKNKISKDTTNWALEIDFTEKLSMLRPWTWVYVGLSNIAWPCLTIKTPFAIFSIESRSDRGTVVKGDSLLHGSGVDLASLTRKKKSCVRYRNIGGRFPASVKSSSPHSRPPRPQGGFSSLENWRQHTSNCILGERLILMLKNLFVYDKWTRHVNVF